MPQHGTCPSCGGRLVANQVCACPDGPYYALLGDHQNERPLMRAARPQRAPDAPFDSSLLQSREALQEIAAAGQRLGRPSVVMDDPTDGMLDLRNIPPEAHENIDFTGPPFSNGDEITFDTEDIEVPVEYPRNMRRFRVDRPPQREPFTAVRVPGPQGGPMREVGRVGRFALLREEDRQLTPAPDLVERPWPERAPRQVPEAAKLNAKQIEKRAALHEKLPTAYERIATGFLGDDDFD